MNSSTQYLNQEDQQFTAGMCSCQGSCVLNHQQICFLFLLGMCKKDSDCYFIHVPSEKIPEYLELYKDEDSLADEAETWALKNADPEILNTDFLTKWPEPTWDNAAYNKERKEQELNQFVLENPDCGKLTVDALKAFEAQRKQQLIKEAYDAPNWSVSTPKLLDQEKELEAMVAYMTKQVELAQKLSV
jgi:hypothetical protein